MGSGFDLEKYLRASKKVETEDLPWDQVREHPLSQGEVRFLRYMMNIEAHTTVYLKELLSTKVIEDAEVTGFLACWNYEEFFHGNLLERFLRTYAGEDAAKHGAKERLSYGSPWGRTVKRLLSPIATAATPDFAATHMTWGAMQELTTLHAYESVARQSRHPVLKEIMARIIRDERRHFAFYFNQAERRLTAEPRMQKVTRWAMDRLWRPVGVGTMPRVESDFTSWYLFRDDWGQNAVREVDANLAELPGMAGWTGLTQATARSIKDALQSEPGLAAWSAAVAPAQGSPSHPLVLA
jgi:rubrerythrin